MSYEHHRCTTCRHLVVIPQTRESPADQECARWHDLDMLWTIRSRKIGDDAASAELSEAGFTTDCPLWESEPTQVCAHHGTYFANHGCESCFYEDVCAPVEVQEDNHHE